MTSEPSITLSPAAGRAVLISTILASSMAFIDSTALNVALPRLQADLGMNASELVWVVNAYALFLSALILVGGSLGDRYGRKRIFMTGIALFAGASLACGLAPTSSVLIAARALQGIGGALMVPGSLAIISASFNNDQRGKAIGTWSTFSTLTTLLGPVLGGWLADQGLWRAIFFINLPLALVALLILARSVPESHDQQNTAPLDIPGALLVTLGLAGVTFGFTEAPNYGFADPLIFIPLVGGLLLLGLFIVVEARRAHPMIPLSLFRSPTFSGTNLLTFFLYAALAALPFFLALNLVQVQGYPSQQAGLALLPLGIILTLISRWAGAQADKLGPRALLTVGPALAGVGFFLFALPELTAGPSEYWTTYFPGALMLGLGMGITVAPLTTAVMGSAPAHSSGTASGINNAVARTAGVLAIAILSALAITTFSRDMTAGAAALDFTPAQIDQITTSAVRLADIPPPAGLSPDAATAFNQLVRASFVSTFRLIALIAALLAGLSALLAFLLVGREQRQ